MRKFCAYEDGSWVMAVRYDPTDLGGEFPTYVCLARSKHVRERCGAQWQTQDPEEFLYHLYNHRLLDQHVPQYAIDAVQEDVDRKHAKLPANYDHHFGR